MAVETRKGGPFSDQSPGTSGLRKSTKTFRQPGYLETFVQAVFDSDPPAAGATLVIGGDGRFFAREAAEIAARMAAANGFERIVVGQGGLLSTPAVSALIRAHDAHGGLVLSASHNPGGPDGDFGVKYNVKGGGPAAPAVTDAVAARAKVIDRWRILDGDAVDLDTPGERPIGNAILQVIDPVDTWLELMRTQFDFEAIGTLLADPRFVFRFDAMNAVTGPYGHALFERTLGAPAGTVLRGVPLPDFGGIHPDPHPDYLGDLVTLMSGSDAASFAAASDGDGDRNMILGPDMIVSPGDSLAILAANAGRIPAFRDRPLKGVARSAPTSRAADRVAMRLGLDLYETPTGWKFFTNLLESGRIGLCGEESFGTGSAHVREKDGLWAILFWLNLQAVTGKSVDGLVRDHWSDYGRDLFQRHDYEGLDLDTASAMLGSLENSLSAAVGAEVCGYTVAAAEVFNYTDPVDGSVAANQGIRFNLSPDARITYRLSGTGTQGATLRVYLEQYVEPAALASADPSALLRRLGEASRELAGIATRLGMTEPSTVT